MRKPCGGGVYIAGGSTFTMNDGEISDNKAEGADLSSGGGVNVYDGTFDMYGGAICGNTVTSTNTTVSNNSDAGGGGVYVYQNSTFTMHDGTISRNDSNKNGGGIFVNDGTLTMIDGTIGGIIDDKNTATNLGGGIYVKNSMFVMNDGTISNNQTNSGGGVYLKNSTFKMNDGTISNNQTSSGGGGVFVSDSSFTMEKGSISKNISKSSGGGVYLVSTTFTMNGGTISDNTAKISGGGIYTGQGITFTMAGGTFSGNKTTNTTDQGKGAYIASICTFNMKGGANFDKNNDVYLDGNRKINITGALTATTTPVATITLSAYAPSKQVLSAGTGVTITQDICDKFAVTPQADGTKWKVALNGNTGVLKKDEVSAGDGGISVILPGQGTYTFKVESDGTEIAEGSTLQSGASVTLSEVKKDGVALTASDGTFSIEIRDESGITLTSATGFPCAVTVPAVPPIGMAMQVYVKVVTGGIVIDKKIAVTGP